MISYSPNNLQSVTQSEMPMPSVRVTTPPENEPVTIAEAKRHLSIAASEDAHDEQLDRLIGFAREQWEIDTHSKMITQTIAHYQERYESMIRLTFRPVQSVESVKYRDADGVLQTVATSDYVFDAASNFVRFKRDYTVPTYQDEWDAWQIEYVAGYGDNSSSVPQLDRQAMLLAIGFGFEVPDLLVSGNLYQDAAYTNLVYRKMRATYP